MTTNRWWQKLKQENPNENMVEVWSKTEKELKTKHWERNNEVDDLVNKGIDERIAKDITYDRMTRELTDSELSYLKNKRDLIERKVSRDSDWTEF